MDTNQQYLSEFSEVLLFIVGGAIFVIVTLFVSRMVRPHRPGTEKMIAYESGEEPIGNAWTQFNIRFYIIAIIFLLFEVEIVFLFPWATVFSKKELIAQTNGAWGWFAVIEAVIFIVILALGLIYAWTKGHLDWIKPEPKPTEHRSPVPPQFYHKINQRYSGRKISQGSAPEGE